MGRQINRLSALAVQREIKPGYHPDGAGLYLQVNGAGSKSWIFRFRKDGRLRDMGLGSAMALSLAEARIKAAGCRKLLLDGVDPIIAKSEKAIQSRLEATQTMTFSQCALAYIEAMRHNWSNDKHAAQWTSTIETYCGGIIGSLPVQAIDTRLVCKVLEQIWTTKNETASRLRGRIEKILDWAKVKGLRTGENPARWTGHLAEVLASPNAIQKVTHHAALPYTEISGFITQLREQPGVAARALEMLILTTVRTGDVTGATWDEFDLAAGLWVIPAGRMKARREHRVPLPPRAVAILRQMETQKNGAFVFPGLKEKAPLSNMAMSAVLKRMGRKDVTVHGFRSTFKDWAAEATTFPNMVSEMALAHTIGSAVEAAYRRGDMIAKRKKLMEAWQGYCERSNQASVTQIGVTTAARAKA